MRRGRIRSYLPSPRLERVPQEHIPALAPTSRKVRENKIRNSTREVNNKSKMDPRTQIQNTQIQTHYDHIGVIANFDQNRRF